MQLLNIIIANGLDGYIDGFVVCPSQFLDAASTSPNPEFSSWHRYNRLLMSWLYDSISDSFLGQIVGFNTAYDIWHSLEQIFTAASFAKICEVRTSLQTLKKDGLTAMVYLQKLKSLCNILASVGDPVPYKDHLIYLLNGRGPEYNSFVISIKAGLDQPTIEEIHSLLLNFDARLDRQSSAATLSSLQANFANLPFSKPKQKPFPSSSSSSHRPSPNRPSRPMFPSPSLSSPYFPTTRPPYRPKCQICFRLGHTAATCYYHNNIQYSPSPPPKLYNACFSHHTSQPPLLPTPSATPHFVMDPNWYMDLGASHHFTPYMNLLDSAQPFHGGDTITVGNGKQQNPPQGSS